MKSDYKQENLDYMAEMIKDLIQRKKQLESEIDQSYVYKFLNSRWEENLDGTHTIDLCLTLEDSAQ